MALLIEILGWAGAVLILAAYGLVASRPAMADRAGYHLMNLAGAAGLTANALWYGALPAVALNLVWAAIGTLTAARILLRRS